MQAQVQIIDVGDPQAGRIRLLEARQELIELADAQDPRLVEFGGGVRDISVRLVKSRAGIYVVAHLEVDVRDAMGANAVNTMAEAVAERVGQLGCGVAGGAQQGSLGGEHGVRRGAVVRAEVERVRGKQADCAGAAFFAGASRWRPGECRRRRERVAAIAGVSQSAMGRHGGDDQPVRP
jgi:hydrogenase maturation factor